MASQSSALIRPRHVLYGALVLMLGCTDQPTMPEDLGTPEFTKVTINDPTRVLTVGVDAPKNLTLKGTVAGIVVVVDSAVVDLSKATVDCSGQTGPDPRIGVWLKGNRRNVHIKGGGTGVIKNCGIGVLIGPPTPSSGEPGGANNHVDGLEIHASQGMLVSNSHENLIYSNRLLSPNGVFVIGNDPKASVSGNNKIYDNTITSGARFSIYASSDSNVIRSNVMPGEAVDAAIAVDRDGNLISDNQTEVGPGGDDPMVGIQVLSGADDNTITKNHLGAGDFGILVEENTFRNTIRGNTAVARSGQDAVDESGDCVNNTWTKNTFRRSDPRCILGITLDAVTFTSPTTIQFEGPGATFNATITNQGAQLTDMALRGWVKQGPAVHRVGGISLVSCRSVLGVLPRGECTNTGISLIASNTSPGTGTLAAGGATAVVEVVRLADGDTTVVDSRSLPITLTAPPTGSYWELRGPMSTPRAGLAAGVVGGSLYVMGGYSGSVIAAVEVYDPPTNSWTSKAPMLTPRSGLAAGVVNDIVYAVGGWAGPYTNPKSAAVEAYDPVTNTWAAKSPMPTARSDLAVGVVKDVLYAVGGYSGWSTLGTVEAYDPLTDSWTTKASLPTPRMNLSIGVVNGLLYAVGGLGQNGAPVATVEAYDPLTDTWVTKSPMVTARWGLAVGTINGVVYAVGGSLGIPGGFAPVERYDPLTNSWAVIGPMPTPRYDLAVGVVNGVLYSAGGNAMVYFDGGGYGCCYATAAFQAFHP